MRRLPFNGHGSAHDLHRHRPEGDLRWGSARGGKIALDDPRLAVVQDTTVIGARRGTTAVRIATSDTKCLVGPVDPVDGARCVAFVLVVR
jgi:hypothetical protein